MNPIFIFLDEWLLLSVLFKSGLPTHQIVDRIPTSIYVGPGAIIEYMVKLGCALGQCCDV